MYYIIQFKYVIYVHDVHKYIIFYNYDQTINNK